MASQAPPTALSRRPHLVVILKENDVLCGRGLRVNKYIGNKRFLRVVESRKEEYKDTISYHDKAAIAKEVYNVVRSRGGRFVRLIKTADGSKRAISVIAEGVWEETDVESALEKCKQALREKKVPPLDDDDAYIGSNGEQGNESRDALLSLYAAASLRIPERMALSGGAGCVAAPASTSGSTAIQPSVASIASLRSSYLGSAVSSAVDSRLLLYQQLLQQQTATDPLYPQFNHSHLLQNNAVSLSGAANIFLPTDRMMQRELLELYYQSTILQSRARDILLGRQAESAARPEPSSEGDNDQYGQDQTRPPVSTGKSEPDKEDAALALFALASPTFTKKGGTSNHDRLQESRCSTSYL